MTTEMTTKITKSQLVDVLTRWGSETITTEQLQLWMLDNFEPDEFIIGENEPEHTIEAMNIVMNEYEIAQQEKCLQGQFQLAINFINATEDNFLKSRNEFLQSAFCD